MLIPIACVESHVSCDRSFSTFRLRILARNAVAHQYRMHAWFGRHFANFEFSGKSAEIDIIVVIFRKIMPKFCQFLSQFSGKLAKNLLIDVPIAEAASCGSARVGISDQVRQFCFN
jgi:hypothetical protein